MAYIVRGDDIVVTIQLYKDNAVYAIDSAAVIKANVLDENGFKMLTDEITLGSADAGADWPNSLVTIIIPEAKSLTLAKDDEAKFEIQVDDSVNTVGKTTTFVPIEVKEHTIA